MIEQNILAIRERMNQAAVAAGRDPKEILKEIEENELQHVLKHCDIKKEIII